MQTIVIYLVILILEYYLGMIYAWFGCNYWLDSRVNGGEIRYCNVHGSIENFKANDWCGVRPVIKLKSEVLTYSRKSFDDFNNESWELIIK